MMPETTPARAPFADMTRDDVIAAGTFFLTRRASITVYRGTVTIAVEHDADVIHRLYEPTGLGRFVAPRVQAVDPRWPRARWEVSGFEPVQALIAAWWPELSPMRRAEVATALRAARGVRERDDD